MKWVRLLAVSAATLVVFRIDSLLYRLLAPWSSALAMLADLRLSSLVLIGLGWAAFKPRLGWQMRPLDRGLVKWTGIWLAGAFVGTHLLGMGQVHLTRWQDEVAFLITGLLAEELLCRGLVLDAATRLWPWGGSRGPSVAAFWSAVIFALMHHQHHAFRFSPAAWFQVAWTFPLGLLLAWLTERTRSLLPAIGVHFLNNLIVWGAGR